MLLDFKTSRMLQLSFLLYIFPVIVLVIGAIIGDSWARSAGMGDPSIGAAISGFAGFFMAIGVILFLEKGAKQSDKYKPVIISIKKRSGNGSSNRDVAKCGTCH